MTDATDQTGSPGPGAGNASEPVPGADGPAESPADTFRRMRMLRQDGYRPRRSEAGPPRHLKLVE